ncbi:MAG: DnaD domain protein [Christensenella sp.]|nr:DnaD domain protein [Christensenella sp.]
MIKFALDEQAFTPVPTIFLKKYMCDAPAEYVKVFLYGLCMANSGTSLSEVELEGELHMSSAQIEAAINYWCLKGLIVKSGAKYQFITGMQGKEEDSRRKKSAASLYEMKEFNNMLCAILKRDLTPTELNKIYDYTDVFGLPQEVVLALIEYCVAERGERISVAYFDKVAEAWSAEGITTQALAQQKIEEYKAVSGGANRLMRLMGLHGKYPGKTEMELYNKWTEKWGFTHEAIEYVMKDKEFSKEQPFKYLDAILRSLYDQGITSSRKISEYYNTQTRRRNAIKEVLQVLEYSRINITPKYEKFYMEWETAGFAHEIILLACTQTAKMGSRRFESVDAQLKEWAALSLSTADDIKKHLKKQNTLDRKIRQFYECAGVQKTLTEADRKNYIRLTQEKGLSHEVLLYAAEISSLFENPLSYMQKVLNSWAENGVDTLDKAKKQNLSRTFGDAKSKKEFEQRSYTEEQRQQRKEDAYEELERLYGK